MIQGFKKFCICTVTQPGSTLLVTGVFCSLIAVFFDSVPFIILAMIATAPAALWYSLMQQPVDNNFSILPSMPFFDGEPYLFLFQRRRNDISKTSCVSLLRSLIDDKHTLGACLPSGAYKTITHDSVIKIFNNTPNIQIEDEPRLVYQSTLRSILRRQTGGRCKRCKARCAAWKAEPRNFYLVYFTVAQGAAADLCEHLEE